MAYTFLQRVRPKHVACLRPVPSTGLTFQLIYFPPNAGNQFSLYVLTWIHVLCMTICVCVCLKREKDRWREDDETTASEDRTRWGRLAMRKSKGEKI